MSRQLATIQTISKLQCIPNSDKLEVATILGWKCVVGRGEFKSGEKVVYCEVDSVLPELPEFEFLRERCFINNGVVKGFRIKTIKLRGQYSQGIVFPLKILEGKRFTNDIRDNPTYEWKDGMEVTGLIGVIQFARPIPAYLSGKVKGDFPTFIPKSDETRVQVLGGLLKDYENTQCYITEKIDGTSATFFFRDGEFGVCSRNLELAKDDPTFHENPRYAVNQDGKYQVIQRDGTLIGEPLDKLPEPQKVSENVYWKIARIYDLENRMRSLGRKLAIQGEIYGEGIQKNYLGIKEQKLAIFNVYDISEAKYLDLIEMMELISQLNSRTLEINESGSEANSSNETKGRLNLEMVPILDMGFSLICDIDKLVEMAKGNSIFNNKVKREGIVIRPIKNVYNVNYSEVCKASRISFKAINQEYLVQQDE